MSTAPPPLRIDAARLSADLDAVNALGVAPGRAGINRPSFSDADMAGRRWLMRRMADAGLAPRMDAVGNVFGRWNVGSGAAVLAGSHLDTVPEGGRFDGALGVCAALEAVRAMREAGVTPRRPVEVICTADEEGRFGGMLGSQAICGLLGDDFVATAQDESGVRLADEMRAQGLDPGRWREAARDDVAVFLELHIEQGPVLEQAGRRIGVVGAVSGAFNWSATLSGQADHSGTTPMAGRRDAFRGLCAFGEALDAVAAAGGPEGRVTVGQAALRPGFPHSIAGEAAFSIIGRAPEAAGMDRIAAACRDALERAAVRHGLGLSVEEKSRIDPAPLDAATADALAADAEALGWPALRMTSGAGHDAQTFARRFRAGLIFVPSVGGVSHAPQEWTRPADVAAGAAVLARAMAREATA
jgi:hydantoinase/carbamoylase family amidase